MTSEEIRIKLGLKPFDEFEYDALLQLGHRAWMFTNKRQAIFERFRQTGRTTKIFCELLEAVFDGYKVTFITNSLTRNKMAIEKIKEYALKLGLNTDLIMNSANEEFTKGHKVKIFKDHDMP